MKSIQVVQYILFSLGFIAIGTLVYIAYLTPKQAAPSPLVTIGIIQYLDLLNPVVDGFKEEMEHFGYIEGQNIIYTFQSANGNIDRISAITDFYISQNVDLIYAVTSVAARGALQETVNQQRTDIPIVWTHADSPVATGLASSLVSSQNNTTGIAVDLKELTGKKLEFLRQMNPSISNIGVFTAAYSDPAAEITLAELRSEATKLNMQIIEYHITNPPGIKAAQEIIQMTEAIQPGEIDALFHTPGPVVNQIENVQSFIELGNRLSIPTAFLSTSHVQQGALFAYSQDYTAIGKQSAHMANKVLLGILPKDIPIEFPDTNVLALNFQTARQIGISFSEAMLTLTTVKFGN